MAAVLFGACWGLAIWYWDATGRSPTTSDLVLYLLALPLALLMATGLPVPVSRHRSIAPAAAAPVQTATAPIGQPPLAILAASLRSPRGESPEELSAAIVKNNARARHRR